jgi:hypothetical protein
MEGGVTPPFQSVTRRAVFPEVVFLYVMVEAPLAI